MFQPSYRVKKTSDGKFVAQRRTFLIWWSLTCVVVRNQEFFLYWSARLEGEGVVDFETEAEAIKHNASKERIEHKFRKPRWFYRYRKAPTIS